MEQFIGEKCGVFGVYGSNLAASRLTFFGLYALQHRGQESSGIATSDTKTIHCYKNTGLVSQVYDEEKIQSLPGSIAIGHNRYSTSAGTDVKHAQPILSGKGQFALAHNGNLPSVQLLVKYLQDKGVETKDKSDSTLITEAITCEITAGASLPMAVKNIFPLLTGVFSLLIMDKTSVIAVRDEYGVRPLSLGTFNGGYVVASETCAFNAVGAKFLRDVSPGEMVVIDSSGISGEQLAEPKQKLDIFEFVYFARPDSVLLGQSVYSVRHNFGLELAKEYKLDADVIVPVPETAVPVALAYSQSTGIPVEMALVKNRYVHRTFIQPDQHLRDMGVRMKLNPLPGLLYGKRVVVIDDSIVRGTTSKQIVRMLFTAGASEVHFLISSPPIRFPDFYGIDLPNQQKLLAYQKSVPEMCEYLGATSLYFLSYNGLIAATGLPESQFNTSVFTGTYPVPLLEREGDFSKEVFSKTEVEKVLL